MGTYKVDNRSLQAKVNLRRWLLQRMKIDHVRVLDACAGEGAIWSAMEEHTTIDRWVRCDIKPRYPSDGMTLKLSAVQSMQSMDLDEFNVIDIDTYGDPWEAYRILLPRLRKVTCVFLTHGRVTLGGDVTNATKIANGLPVEWRIPQILTTVEYIAQRCLESTWHYADILHAGTVASAPGQGRASLTYYGLGLKPKIGQEIAHISGGAEALHTSV